MLAKAVSLFLLGLVRLLTGAQARWHGCPPKAEQRIYFANHQSHADLVMIWAALPEELRAITRPIAARDYWTRTRLRAFPEVPTLMDLGYGMVVTSPYGIVGPKGMEADVTEWLHQAFRRLQHHPRVQEYMARNDMPDEYLGPAEYTAFARERAVYEQRMVTRLNLSID